MKKLLLVPLLFIIACLLAGLYGSLHNQISYSVSQEYFTKFKFHQFHIAERTPERLGAAIVGRKAAWWMGILIGIFLIPFGLIIRGTRLYFFGMLRAFAVVVVTTLTIGLAALAFASVTISAENVGQYHRYGNKIENNIAYARAGTMHNFSYLGGGIGIITGGIFIVRERKQQKIDA